VPSRVEGRASRPNSAGFLLVEVLVALFLASLIFLVLAALISFAVFVAKTSDNLTGATALAATKIEELRSTDYDALSVGGSTAADVTDFFDEPDIDADGQPDFHRRWEVIDQGTTKLIRVYVSSELEMVGMPKDASVTLVVAEK
jgi:type II secretory pathway pseudopilin PulG